MDKYRRSFEESSAPPAYSEYEGASTSIVARQENATRTERVELRNSTKLQRNIFQRYVYGILTIQGVVVCGIIALLLFIPNFRSYFQELSFFKFWAYWFGGTITACFVTTLYKLMRKPPVNLILLALVTASTGFIMGTLAARVERQYDVLICIGIISGVCLFVFLFTFQVRYPYTPTISILYVSTLLLVALGILYATTQDIIYSLILMIAPTILSIYFVIVTQLLVKDENKNILSNEYVYGAIQTSMYLVAVFAKIAYRIFSTCCPCCACCCDNCGDICNDL